MTYLLSTSFFRVLRAGLKILQGGKWASSHSLPTPDLDRPSCFLDCECCFLLSVRSLVHIVTIHFNSLHILWPCDKENPWILRSYHLIRDCTDRLSWRSSPFIPNKEHQQNCDHTDMDNVLHKKKFTEAHRSRKMCQCNVGVMMVLLSLWACLQAPVGDKQSVTDGFS